MKKAFGDYKRLAGGARIRGSLWEGRDHLLYIDSVGFLAEFTENYRRIDYAKIRALVFGRTSSWYATLILQALVVIVFGWVEVQWWLHRAVRYGNDYTPFAVIGIPVLLLTIPYFINNWVKGPTCKLMVHTAVQILHVKPVRRVKEARRIVARVTELCLQHQDGVPLTTISPQSPSAAAPAVALKKPFSGSPFMRWGFLGLLVGGGLAIGEMYVDSVLYFVADVLLNLAAGIAVVVGLLRCSGVDLPGGLKGAVWGAIGNLVFGVVLSFGLYVYGSILLGLDAASHREDLMAGGDVSMRLFVWLAHAGFKELDWAGWLVVGVGGFNVFFALMGLPYVLRSPVVAEVQVPVLPVSLPAANAQPEWMEELPPVPQSPSVPLEEQVTATVETPTPLQEG